MLFRLTFAGKERNLAKQLQRAGKVSKAISNQPVLLPGLEIYLDAFFELNNERSQNGFIPTLKILEYSRIYGLADDTRDEMVTLIRQMDVAFVNHKNESSRISDAVPAKRQRD